jgi:hypothetical protein
MLIDARRLADPIAAINEDIVAPEKVTPFNGWVRKNRH